MLRGEILQYHILGFGFELHIEAPAPNYVAVEGF